MDCIRAIWKRSYTGVPAKIFHAGRLCVGPMWLVANISPPYMKGYNDYGIASLHTLYDSRNT